MLAHVVHNDPKVKAAAGSIKVSAVGVATPAVLTEPLAEQCSDYITSVVLMVSQGLSKMGHGGFCPLWFATGTASQSFLVCCASTYAN
jgi:hypothetical protein